MQDIPNIPEAVDRKRVVIVGGGFAGLKLARKLSKRRYQVVLIDRRNYHQFQPLFYQVATAGLEPALISFPFRKVLQKLKHMHFRMARFQRVDTAQKCIETNIGKLRYDYLVLAPGATTNFFGNAQIAENAIPMKTVPEAIFVRNSLLRQFEAALNAHTIEERNELMTTVVVGGGPTGVELAGALAEMKRFVLPNDYPELDFRQMRIVLMEGADRLLNGMSDKAGRQSLKDLQRFGVEVVLNTFVKSYDGHTVEYGEGDSLNAATVLWAAGIKVEPIDGLNADTDRAGRIMVDDTNRISGLDDVFVLGDAAAMISDDYPDGHPQIAPVAQQQAGHLIKNLDRVERGQEMLPFRYVDKGTMATIGRHRAVADLKTMKLSGPVAWFAWLFIHLVLILGTRNKLVVFLNWAWSYLTYDQSLRLIIRSAAVDRLQEKLDRYNDTH